LDNIRELLHHPDLFQTAHVTPAELPFSVEVTKACEQNACGKYGRSWTCPPAVGTAEENREKLLAFSGVFVATHVGRLEDSFDIDGMTAAGRRASEILRELSARLDGAGIRHRTLGCGACSLCKPCTCPDEPCRFPEKAIVSVEACGIDVVALSRICGINYHNGANTVTYFFAILT